MARLHLASLLALALVGCTDEPHIAGGAGGSPTVEEPRPVWELELDFGAVAIGSPARQRIEIHNTGPNAAALWLTELTGPFALVAAPGELAGGGAAEIEVEFRPEEPGLAGGDARLRLGRAEIHLALRGNGVPPGDESCLAVSPSTIVFESSCTPTSQSFTVTSHCAAPAELVQALVELTSFRVLEPELPLWLEPGDSTTVTVEHDPYAKTLDAPSALLRLVVSGGGMLEIQLDAPAPALMRTHDTFHTDPRLQVDTLIVVDPTAAQDPYAGQLAELGRSLVTYQSNQGLDFRMLVASTALGSVVLPRSGNGLVAIDRTTPDGGELLAATLLEAARDPAAGDQALEAARHALIDGPDAGAITREGAHLTVLFVSARDDGSPRTTSDYYGDFLGVKGFRNSNLIGAHAIVPDGCEELTDAARFLAIVEAFGGLTPRICTGEWFTQLERIWTGPFDSLPGRFYLTNRPLDLDGDGALSSPDELEVIVNGVSVPPVLDQMERVWELDPGSNAVEFFPLHQPDYDSTIEIHYTARCAP